MRGVFELFSDRQDEVAQAAAGAPGVQFAEGDLFGSTRAPFPLLHRGDRRVVERVLWREGDAHCVRVFDYRYEDVSGENKRRSPRYTCATALANAAWPYTDIDPASALTDFSGFFGGNDRLDIPDDAFADAFVVHGTDHRFASAFLEAGTRAFLLNTARALSVTLNGAWLLVSSPKVPADLVPAYFGFVDDLLRHLEKPTRAIAPGPLPGDLHRAMPDPGAVRITGGGLDPFARSDEGGATLLEDELLGFHSHVPAVFRDLTTAGAAEMAEQAIRQRMLADPAWEEVFEAHPLGALREPEAPERGVDGELLPRGRQDPWGPGRPGYDWRYDGPGGPAASQDGAQPVDAQPADGEISAADDDTPG